jgi:hypothetical protein
LGKRIFNPLDFLAIQHWNTETSTPFCIFPPSYVILKQKESEVGFDAYYVSNFCGVVVLKEEFTLEESLAARSLVLCQRLR